MHNSFTYDQWGPSYRCTDLVYKVLITNTNEGPIQAKVTIKEGELAEMPINLNWPKTGIKGEVDGKETAIVAFLSKITPSEATDAENGGTEI